MDKEELIDVDDVSVLRKSKRCVKCSEWKEKFKQLEERFTQMKTEFETKMNEPRLISDPGAQKQPKVEPSEKVVDHIEEKITPVLDGSMSVAEARKNVGEFIDLTEDTEDNKLMDLMIEIKVLNIEKQKAENDVKVWKTKCNDLESRVKELEQRVTGGVRECFLSGVTELGLEKPEAGRVEINDAKGLEGEPSDVGTHLGDTYENATPLEEGNEAIPRRSGLRYGGRARKQLLFGEETSFNKKIVPVTPTGMKSACRTLIDISESDDEGDAMELILPSGKDKKEANDTTYPSGGTALHKNQFPFPSEDLTSPLEQSYEDTVTYNNDITRKRRRASHIITSDSESDSDDDLPISRLRTKFRTDGGGEPVVLRRLVSLRNFGENRTFKENSPSTLENMKTERLCGIPTHASSEEDESEGERRSLKDFIVSDSDISSDGSAFSDLPSDESISDGDQASTESGDESDFPGESGDEPVDHFDYREIIAKIGRFKDHKGKWEYLADLQAAFGKDPELCMKAVCALYRQQTPDEKSLKATFVLNGLGFSHVDAERGTSLGEFLTDGCPEGDLRKSVEELEAYDKKGLETCRILALKYAKQLFGLYWSGEDPFWCPDSK